MLKFLQKYESKVMGVLTGFDRLVFHGTLRTLMFLDGMKLHLSRRDVPRRDFARHSQQMTERLKEASLGAAKTLERPVIYLQSSQTRKEAVARDVLKEHPVNSGLICVLSCVEPCKTYQMQRDREAKQLRLVHRLGRCMYIYHYYLDPQFGFMHARIQTWYPFCTQVCINAREWLARRMEESGLGFAQHENAFVVLDDIKRSQLLMDRFLTINWSRELDTIIHRLNPAHDTMFAPDWPYYWSVYQSEWATDVLFRNPAELAALYPPLVWGAITTFTTPDVMRFLGKRMQISYDGEAISQYLDRPEGIRVKHRVSANSIKMYDKAGRILRVETTLNNPRNIKIYRAKEGDDAAKKTWRPLRKGVADLHRRAQVCQRANERYLDAIAEFDTDTTLAQILHPLCKRVTRNGKTVRSLRPWSPEDIKLIAFINRPEYLLNGFSNSDLATSLFPSSNKTLRDRRIASGKTGYRIRILRAHGLIAKLPNTRRYRITQKGRQVATAILLAQKATIKQLNAKAA